MATISKRTRKKGIIWQVKVRRNGKAQSASFSTKKQAEDWSRNVENTIEMEKYFPSATPQKPVEHTVGDLLDIYQERIVNHHSEGTRDVYTRCLKYWRSALGDTLVKNVTPSLIEDCRYYLLNKRGLDAQTVNLYTFSIRPAFAYAESDSLNWITKNPFSKIKKLKEKPGLAPMFTDQQIQDLLDWCDRSNSPHLWLFSRLILGTGGRKQEVLQAKWGQINFKRHTINFPKTKSKRQRTLPIPTSLVEILQDVYTTRFGEDAGLMNFPDQEYIFPSARDPRKPAVNIHAAWNRARAKAGLPEFRIHSGRHHYASRLMTDGGADILAVSLVLGHSDVKQSARYAHLHQSHIASAVEKMASNLSL